MSIVDELLWTGILPLLVAAATMAAARGLALRPRAAWAAAVGIGYVVGQIVSIARGHGLPTALRTLVVPREASDWLPPAVLVAMGLTLLAAATVREWQHWIVALAALLSVGMPARMLAGSVYVTQDWSIGEKLMRLVLLAAALTLMWLLLAAADDDQQPRLRTALLVLVAMGMAATLTLSGSFALGKLCGVVAAALCGAAIVSSRANVAIAGAAGVVTMSLGSLILLAHYYSNLSATNAALLALAVVAGGGRMPRNLATGRIWRPAAIRVGLCLVPLAIAAATAR